MLARLDAEHPEKRIATAGRAAGLCDMYARERAAQMSKDVGLCRDCHVKQHSDGGGLAMGMIL